MSDDREQVRAHPNDHLSSYALRPLVPLSLERVRTLLAERYVVTRELGSGGTSVVFLAHDRERGCDVAVKLLRPELSAAVVAARFLREIEIGQSLAHEHILPIFESGVAEGELYFTMPFVDGETLQARLERETQLSIEETLAIARSVASALDHSHERGVVHRDIKPANILLDGARVVVTDFGIARAMTIAATSPLTESGVVIGTALYMSPEQGTAERQIDGRSDVYALGCVVYEMLGGEPPFTGPTARAVVARHCQEPPRSLRVVRPALPEGMQHAVEKALAKVPHDRFATAGAFIDALERAAREPAGAGRSATRAGRRRALAIAAVAGTVTIVALGGLWVRAERRALAESRLAQADTARLLVFPIETDGASSWGGAAERQLRRALTSWSGVTILDPSSIRDVVDEGTGQLSSARARDVALDLQAGRYLRLTAATDGERRLLRGMLLDVARPESPLAELSVVVDSDDDPSIGRLADWLLLRPVDSATFDQRPVGTSALPAFQAFLRGRAEIERWQLAAAESAFVQATLIDPRYARASLWLALVRAWAGQATPTWSHALEVASTGRAMVPPIDHTKLDAMLAARANDPVAACAVWDRNTREQPADYAAWFGSAKCLRDDQVVLPDARSVSGWRFRTSYRAALERYLRALQLAPSMVSGFRDNGFAAVRQWLWTSQRQLRPGRTEAGPLGEYIAFPSLDHDTLAFIPFRSALIELADPLTMQQLPRSVDAAVRRQRQLFVDVALQWQASAPTSAQAEQALAVALLHAGNASALDHIIRGTRLTADPLERQRLLATELWIRTQLALPDDPGSLRTVRVRVDSLLRAAEPTAVEPRMLASLAALIGKVVLADHLDGRRRSTRAGGSDAQLTALSRSLAIHAAFGGQTDSLRALESRIESLIAAGAPEHRDAMRLRAYRQAALTAYPRHAFAAYSAIDTAGTTLPAAMNLARRGDSTAVRRLLGEMRRTRQIFALAESGLDAVHLEAQLLAWLGEERQAIAEMDLALAQVRHSPSLTEPVQVAMLLRTMLFRAELAAKAGDSATAARWSNAVAALWSGADASMQSMVQRQRRFTK